MVDEPQAPIRTAPDFLPVAAIPFFNMGVERLCAPEILQDPTAWLTAYAALMADNFSPAMMTVLHDDSPSTPFSARGIQGARCGTSSSQRPTMCASLSLRSVQLYGPGLAYQTGSHTLLLLFHPSRRLCHCLTGSIN